MNKPLAILLLLLAGAVGISGVLLLRDSAPLFQAAALVRPAWDETDLPAVRDLPPEMQTVVLLQNEASVAGSDVVLRKLLLPPDENAETAMALERLRQRVTVAPVPGANLLRLAAQAESAPAAMELANQWAQAYCDYRVERRHRLAREALALLAGNYESQANQVRAAEQAVAAARAALGADRNPMEFQVAAPGGETETLRDLRSQLARVTMVYLTQSNQLARSQNFPTNELRELEVQVARVKTELDVVTAAVAAEAQQHELWQAYWQARRELEEAESIFAPLRAAVAGHERDLAQLPQRPAEIDEVADAAMELPARRTNLGWAGVVGAGGLTLAAAALWFRAARGVRDQAAA